MMRTRPKNVVRTGPVRLPRKGVVSLTDPRTQAPTFVRPAKSDGRSTMYAISEASARSPSESMAPPPTGSASVSTSSCLEEEELLTRLCHPEIAPRIEQEWAGRHGYGDVREGRREGTDEKEDDCGVRRIEGQIVRRLNEHGCREHGGRVQDHRADEAPYGDIPHAPRQGNRKPDPQVDAEDHECQSDSCDREHVHLHPIKELSAQESRQENAHGRDEGSRELVPERRDQGDEGRRDDDQIEQDEGQKIRAPASACELIRDRTERPALFPYGQHHRAIVLEPSDEEVPADDPQQGGEPTKRNPNERTENRSKGRDAFELVPPKHVPTHGEVLHPVHVHVGRRRFLRVRTPDVPVNPLAISPIGDRIQRNRRDDPQERSREYVHHPTSSHYPGPCDGLS